MGENYLAMKLKDQERAIALLAGDPQLAGLRQVCRAARTSVNTRRYLPSLTGR